MEAPPGEGRSGGISKELRSATADRLSRARLADSAQSAGCCKCSNAESKAGVTAGLDGCAAQQGIGTLIAPPQQSVTTGWQHSCDEARCGRGRQAKAGAAVQRTTATSIINAPFLLMFTVYPTASANRVGQNRARWL